MLPGPIGFCLRGTLLILTAHTPPRPPIFDHYFRAVPLAHRRAVAGLSRWHFPQQKASTRPSSHGRLRDPALGLRRPDGPEAAERARPQGRRLRRPRLHAPHRQERPGQHLVRPGPPQVPGPLLGADPLLPHRRVPRRLRLGHRRPLRRPGDLRQEPRAGGDPQPLGHAGRPRVRLPGDPLQERRQVRGGRLVQGGRPDLLRGRPRLPGQPQPGARPEHPRHLGLPGRPHGLRGGLPGRGRPARGGARPDLPGRRLRPARPRRRPGGLRRAQGEGDQEWAARHVLHVRVLRAGHRHRQGPHREPLRPRGRPGRQQRLGLRHQLRARQVRAAPGRRSALAVSCTSIMYG